MTTLPDADYFDEAFDYVMEKEDYRSDDPDDPGMLTIWGLSSKSWPDDVRLMSTMGKDQSREYAKKIYREEYWDKPGIWRISDKGLAIKTFSMAVLLGWRRAIKLLQGACNDLGGSLVLDGRIGERTELFLDRFRWPDALEESFEALLTAEFKRLGQSKYIAGWLRRVDEDAA